MSKSFTPPTSAPSSYKTLKGLLNAVERVCYWNLRGVSRFGGQSSGMWLQNAEYMAETEFGDGASVRAIRERYSITRPEDLLGGHSLFGNPLPRRSYEVGDNIPGVGRISDMHRGPSGTQFLIEGQWMHERCFAKPEHRVVPRRRRR